MTTLQFKVTLLSDVIINQRAATEGNQNTLNFIPGSAFLGVAAGELYKAANDESFLLFHSGKVRFGDAHPLVDGKRALKVPASWYKKKDDKEDLELFVHHGLPKEGLKDESGNPVQVKQYREDFIVNQGENKVSKVEINKHFAIKSAYDSDKRRSEDAKMYGYESLQTGSNWCFSVEIDDNIEPVLIEKLEKALTGNKRVGRSSSAQYGLVKIEKVQEVENTFKQWSQPETRDKSENVVFVYAESRLIFIDKFGQPTFNPTVEQLGFTVGEICREMCQVRTFQYAPYNNHRKTRDADRLGIEKGSVFFITGVTPKETEAEKWVGTYQNEGFGKVLINPEFLEYTEPIGKATFKIVPKAKRPDAKHKEPSLDLYFINKTDSLVWGYLVHQSNQANLKTEIYSPVNKIIESPFGKSFEGKDKFASQWGTIRSLATQIKTKNFSLKPQELKDLLIKKLFEEKEDTSTHKKIGVGYLKHGVAAEKWEHKSEQLKTYLLDLKPEIAIDTVINLAAEMAKKCRRN